MFLLGYIPHKSQFMWFIVLHWKKTKTKRLNKQKPKEFLWFFKQISLFQCMLLLSLKSRSFPSSACSEGLKWHCIKSFSCCQNSFPLRIQASIVFIILSVYLKMFNFCFLHEYQAYLPFLPLWSGWWLSFCCWMIVNDINSIMWIRMRLLRKGSRIHEVTHSTWHN